MVSPPSLPNASRAEKRVLWEVRQRYQVKPPPRPQRSAHPPLPPHKPPRQPIGGAGRSGRPGRAGFWARRITLLVILLLILSGGVFGYKILAAGNKISVADRSLLGQLKDLLFQQGQQLEGESDGRINILLIAIGGEGHSGEDLADTIMVASIRPQDNATALLSIPRDLYVQVPDEQYFSKLNAVHAHGESIKKNYGPELLRKKVEEITGQPIHYYARVDFTAFKNIVDAVGGVNITTEKSFHDYWHKISFPAGTEKMNGERALAYVRARYVEGSEGGDFKRAQRQQQVLIALRDKVFSVQTAFDFTSVNAILNSLSDNIRTDMQLWEMKRFYELARLIDHNQIRSVVLDSGANGVLVGGTQVLGGTPASVLQPRTGDYSEIQAIAADIFSTETSAALSASSGPQSDSQDDQPPEIPEHQPAAKPTLEIRNGTNITGLAGRTSENLQGQGYEVLQVGNAKNRATQETTVYALSSAHTDAAKELATALGASADSGLPAEEAASQADVLIILGQDAPQ